jgi:hypothetical protein
MKQALSQGATEQPARRGADSSINEIATTESRSDVRQQANSSRRPHWEPPGRATPHEGNAEPGEINNPRPTFQITKYDNPFQTNILALKRRVEAEMRCSARGSQSSRRIGTRGPSPPPPGNFQTDRRIDPHGGARYPHRDDTASAWNGLCRMSPRRLNWWFHRGRLQRAGIRIAQINQGSSSFHGGPANSPTADKRAGRRDFHQPAS